MLANLLLIKNDQRMIFEVKYWENGEQIIDATFYQDIRNDGIYNSQVQNCCKCRLKIDNKKLPFVCISHNSLNF